MNIRKHMHLQSPERRFAVSYVADPISGCWLWEGTLRNGYGTIRSNGRQMYAHRLSWAIHRGPVDGESEVCHHCDNKCCVNPAHLFLGSHQDNMLDAWNKSIVKQPPIQMGESHHASRVTASDVRTIRNRRANGEKLKSIAADYGMTAENISSIVHRKTWKEVQ